LRDPDEVKNAEYRKRIAMELDLNAASLKLDGLDAT